MLTKQETLLGRGAWAENRKVREPSRTALPMWVQVSGFMVKGFISGLSLGNQGPSWWHTYCSAKMDSSEEDSGRLVPFPNSSDCFWLVISMFLTRTSCHKITHASVYYGSWPGWVVSVSISLTEWHDIAMRGKKGSFPRPLQTCSLHLRFAGEAVPPLESWFSKDGENVKVLVAQSCPTVCDPVDCNPLGSSLHGILQARILVWVVISFSRGRW